MYAREAIVIHGPFYGCLLSFKRFIKCQPWGGTGYDPVPLNTEPRNKHCSMPQKAMKKLLPLLQVFGKFLKSRLSSIVQVSKN